MRNGAGNVMKGLARGMHRLTHAAYLLIHTHLHVRQISNELNYCLLILFFMIFCSQKENQGIRKYTGIYFFLNERTQARSM